MTRIIRWLRSVDWLLVLVPVLMVGLGLTMIFTLGQAQNRPELFWSQLTYAGLALVVYVVAASIDLRALEASSWLLYGGGLVLLGIVLVVGHAQFGAQRWLNLGPFQLQPAELMKAIIIVGTARLLAGRIGRVGWRPAVAVLVLLGIPTILILAQPDLGSAIVLIGVVGTMLIASRLNRQAFFVCAALAVVAIGIGWLSLRDYQRARIETFLHPSHGENYNVEQSIIAVGSGGLTGSGIGRGSQTQLNFLPVAHTDFMFATVAEATGLIGATALLLLYATLIWRCFAMTRLATNSFAMLVAVGVGSMLLIQVLINVGMNIGLAPVTGIPLPLVSHGGSSLLISALLLGLVQGIYRRRVHQRLGW